MKKVIMLAMVAFMTLAMSQKAQAIEDPNPKGTMVIGIRAGIRPLGYIGLGGSVVGDYTLVDSWWKGHFTVGGYAGYNFTRWDHESDFAFMPRATYGLNITKEFEAHVAVMTGVCWRHWPSNYYEHNNEIRFAHGEVVGARYMFTPGFGVEAEMGYVSYMSYLNIGVTFKL